MLLDLNFGHKKGYVIGHALLCMSTDCLEVVRSFLFKDLKVLTIMHVGLH